jgi:hypothetical protein
MHPDAALRRITTWLAIVGYTLVASGLPLPCGVAPAVPDAAIAKRLGVKDRSRPFPCMDKPCGCDTADRCFTSCCCHTPAETLAWARAHGVDAGVLVALERRAAVVDAAPPEEGTCCAAKPIVKRAQAGCCATTDVDLSGPDVCSEYQVVATDSAAACETSSGPETAAAVAATLPERPETADQEAPRRVKTVSLRAMLACGGIVAEWFLAGVAAPPPKLEVFESLVCVGRVAAADACDVGGRDAPESPPPRVG